MWESMRIPSGCLMMARSLREPQFDTMVRNVFAAEGQVISLKKKERRYKEIIRRLLSDQPLTADEKAFLKKEGVKAKKG